MTARAACLLAAVVLAPLAAAGQGAPLRPDDRQRIESLDAAAGSALREALAGGTPEDVVALTRALSGQPVATAPAALAGAWSCRTIKAGGLVPLVVYSPFRCAVTVAGGTVTFEKTSGSQRVRGELLAEGGRLLLLGVGYIAGDTPPAYGALPARIDPAADPQRVAAPGVVEMAGPARGRILFPWPTLESRLDVLELWR